MGVKQLVNKVSLWMQYRNVTVTGEFCLFLLVLPLLHRKRALARGNAFTSQVGGGTSVIRRATTADCSLSRNHEVRSDTRLCKRTVLWQLVVHHLFPSCMFTFSCSASCSFYAVLMNYLPRLHQGHSKYLVC